MNDENDGTPRFTEAQARERGTYKLLVDCDSLKKARKYRVPFTGLVEEVRTKLESQPGIVWCYQGTGTEVDKLRSAFRSHAQLLVQTRCARSEIYVSLRRP